MIKKIIVPTILMFLILYPLKFNFFPLLTTRVIIGLFGVLLFLIRNKNVHFDRLSKKIITCVFSISIVSILTIIINGSSDLTFVILPITVLLIAASAYFVNYIIYKLKYKDYKDSIPFYFILAVDLQLILSTLFFVAPQFKDLMLSFLTAEFQPLSLERAGEMSFRMTGFGVQYATAGMIHSAAAVLCAFCMCRIDITNRLFYLFSFLAIVVIGNALSRTTLVGVIVAFVYIVWAGANNFIKTYSKFIIVAVISLYIFLPNLVISSDIDQQLRFAFEVFYNYHEGGGIQTASTTALFESYSIMPNNLMTWILGDGRFNGNDSESNYMETDFGFARLVFYFGLIGTFLFVKLHKFLQLKMALNVEYKKLSICFLVLFIILNFKGYCLYVLFFFLFMFDFTEKKCPVENIRFDDVCNK